MNTLIYLYNKYPNALWNCIYLSNNQNINYDIIANNLDKPWHYYLLSQNPSLPWKIIEDNPNKYWYFECISNNYLNITVDILENNLDKPWDYNKLYNNPCLTSYIKLNNLLDKKHKYSYGYYYKNFKLYKDLKDYGNLNRYYKPEYLEFYDKYIDIEKKYYQLKIETVKDNLPPEQMYNTWDYFIWDYEEDMNKLYKNYDKNITYDINCFINDILCHPELTLNKINEFIENKINIDFLMFFISKNNFLYDDYYISSEFKKKLVNQFMEKCKEELIAKVCTPKRIFNWNEDTLLDKEHPLYGYTENLLLYV